MRYGIDTTVSVSVSVPDTVSVSDSVEKNCEKKKKNVFIPPTLEEVQAYVLDKGLNVDAKKFLDYFEATGWVDSKGQPVNSWKGKIQTWASYNPTTPQQPKKQRYTFADLLEEEYGNDKERDGWDTGDNANCISPFLPDTIPRGYQESG